MSERDFDSREIFPGLDELVKWKLLFEAKWDRREIYGGCVSDSVAQMKEISDSQNISHLRNQTG